MGEVFSADPMLWFAIFVLVGAGLATIAIWTPRRLRWKVSAVCLTGALAATAYISLADMLGRPKPLHMELAADVLAEATVVASELQEPDAIYLWLRFDDQTTPRAYALPWSLETARELQEMMQAAEQRGTTVRVRQEYANSLDTNEPLFYLAPQTALPPKSAS